MNLPFIKNFNKKVLPSYFLVLVLRDEKANAVIFQELEVKVKIVGLHEEYFSSSIDAVSQDEFLEVLDKAISQAEITLPENVQTQKTIFGVKESWTDNDQIKKHHLAKLKKASEELGLTPIGFLVISQAISHLLQKEEGAPISAILTEVNRKSITVTLVRAGKSIETKSSEIHESIPFTVDTLLKHFNVPEILPSRIIIFNGKEDLSQEFISHTWSKSLPFLHLPQITNLPLGFDAKSVLFGAATQMGFEVLAKDIPKEPLINKEPTENLAESLLEKNPISKKTQAHKNIEAENFGFTKDMDVAKMEFQDQPAHNQESPETTARGEGLRPIKINVIEETIPSENKSTQNTNSMLTQSKNILIMILSLILIAIRKMNIKKVLSILNKIPKGKITILVPMILLLILGLIASYFLLLKATIAVTIDPTITEQTKNVIFSTKEKTDSSKNIIKGGFVSVSEDGTVSTAATGKKDVGTKAKGTVTIFNSLSQSKTLAEGIILKTPNGLEFTLDSSISIKAVASHSADETVTPEKTTTNVTANQLGKESNLPSGTKFTVAFFDTADLIAKNDNPFSGGTKKEVTVVSKEDLGKLEEELPKQLEDKAREALKKQIGQEKVLLPLFISNSLGKKTIDAKVGDEKNQVTLTGTVKYQGIAYDRNDLRTFSKSLLEKDVPSNREIDYNNIKTVVLDIKEKQDEEVEANLNIKALLLPIIDESKLAKDLKGKSFKTAQDLLYKLPQVSDIDIYLSPRVPFLPKKLPSREKNIKIIIKIDG